ncbi:hypothetical protein IMSAG049_00990 [Clostridiales bacterium]|nr:hypothetical protein IMSAG049_00990 [Clostridiales bacterium]
MNTYNDMLRENFKDYEVLYRRANQYYHHQEYLKALDDLDSAVKYAPVTDTEMLFPIYALRSATYWQMKRYTLSLQEINKALEIDPSNYAAVNMRADIEVELGNYTAAKEDYTKLQSLLHAVECFLRATGPCVKASAVIMYLAVIIRLCQAFFYP